MKQQFVIRNEKTKSYFWLSRLLGLLNLIGLIILLIQNDGFIKDNWPILIAVVMNAFFLVFVVVKTFIKKPEVVLWYRHIFFLSALVWGYTDYWLIAGLLIVFIFLDYLSHRKLIVTVSDKQIILPRLINQKVSWDELTNLVLKDGLLTIDFKNNTLFQQLVVTPDRHIDEDGFNTFCKNQLAKSQSGKTNDLS